MVQKFHNNKIVFRLYSVFVVILNTKRSIRNNYNTKFSFNYANFNVYYTQALTAKGCLNTVLWVSETNNRYRSAELFCGGWTSGRCRIHVLERSVIDSNSRHCVRAHRDYHGTAVRRNKQVRVRTALNRTGGTACGFSLVSTRAQIAISSE